MYGDWKLWTAKCQPLFIMLNAYYLYSYRTCCQARRTVVFAELFSDVTMDYEDMADWSLHVIQDHVRVADVDIFICCGLPENMRHLMQQTHTRERKLKYMWTIWTRGAGRPCDRCRRSELDTIFRKNVRDN